MENWLYQVKEKLQNYSLRMQRDHFYSIHMMTHVLFEDWSLMTTAWR